VKVSPRLKGSEPKPFPVRLHLTLHTLAFMLGLSAIFIALGFSAGLVSNFLFNFGDIVGITAGIFLILMGLVRLGLIPVPFLQRDLRLHMQNKPTGYVGSALVGVAFAAGWTPCIGPMLAGILSIAATTGSAAKGGLLLGFYALGLSIPFLIFAQALPAWKMLLPYAGIIERVGGLLLILVGSVLLTGSIKIFGPYLASLGSLEGLILGGPETPTLGLSFLAGTLSFLSPCVLPLVPSFLGYLTGSAIDQVLEGSKI
jgi:cytochrome c-type biogenesis protein